MTAREESPEGPAPAAGPPAHVSSSAATSIIRQARILVVGYGTLGVLGLMTLVFDQSWLTIVCAVFPLQVAAVDWKLSRRFAADESRRTAAPLLWHQAWVLMVGWGICAILLNWPIAALWSEIPPHLQYRLEEATALFGMTPEAYLELVWGIAIAITAILFTLKIVFVAGRYSRLIRQLPDIPIASRA